MNSLVWPSSINSVEFLGIPGSGKSTLLKMIHNEISENTLPIQFFDLRKTADFYKNEVNFLIFLKKFFYEIIFYNNKSKNFQQAKKYYLLTQVKSEYTEFFYQINNLGKKNIFQNNKIVKDWIYAECIAYFIYKKVQSLSTNQTVLLADESFSQRLMFFCDSSSNQDLFKLLSKSPSFDVTVVFRPNLELFITRRLQKLTGHYLNNITYKRYLFTNYSKFIDDFIQCHPNNRLILLDPLTSAQENKNILLSSLHKVQK